MSVNGICCEEIKALVEKKEEGFKTLCVQRNTLARDCCDDIKKEVASFEDAYRSLCGNISGTRSLIILTTYNWRTISSNQIIFFTAGVKQHICATYVL